MQPHDGELISAYIDDELSKEETLLIEEHLETCKECQELVSELSGLKRKVSTTYQAIKVPGKIEEKVLAKIGQRRTSGKPLLFALPWISAALMAVTISIFLLSLLPATDFSLGLTASVFNVLLNLIHLVPVLIGVVPFLLETTLIFAIILLLISLWSLRHMLIVKREII